MKSRKITQNMSTDIVSALKKHAFGKRCEAFVKESKALALAVYDAVYSTKQKTLIASLPDGWLPMYSSVKCQFGGQVYEFEFDGRDYRYSDIVGIIAWNRNEAIRKPFPDCDGRKVVKSFPAKHALTQRVMRHVEKGDDLKVEISKATRQANAVLHSVNTTKQLVEAWPEVKEYLPFEGAKAVSTALVIPRDDLNKMFAIN